MVPQEGQPTLLKADPPKPVLHLPSFVTVFWLYIVLPWRLLFTSGLP
jgi:hypothetical protein